MLQEDGEPPLPKRKSSRSVKRRTFEDIEPDHDDDDSWEIGCDSESRGAGGHKRRRPNSGSEGLGPAEDRRFGKTVVAASSAFLSVPLCGLTRLFLPATVE